MDQTASKDPIVLGVFENAVKIQVWVAISVYVLVAIARKKLNISNTMYQILQYISISPFEKVNLAQIFTDEIQQDVKELKTIQLKML